MSGIVGVVRTDGAPVDVGLIQHLTRSLTWRGPDAIGTWCQGAVALGHTHLEITNTPGHEHQPFSLDGHTWIVADARIDARDELIANLGSDGSEETHAATDAALILSAYARWGEGCVDRLLGDFAFAIWDADRRSLFCARDHMGVRPFYYASVGRWLLFSNTLECVRQHEAVPDALNDHAIADFLLFGANQDRNTTTFQNIHRLPPAHTLTWSDRGLSLRRYWTLPIEDPVYYRRDSEYVDHFSDLLRYAVSDRLRRTDRVGVFMSGGLDSPALAAAALNVFTQDKATHPVRAFTFVFDSLIPDQERQFAGLVSRQLAIPISFYPLDGDVEWVTSQKIETPEPIAAFTALRTEQRCCRDVAAHSRVAFWGEGPDNALLYEWQPHVRYLIRRRRWFRLLGDLGKHLRSHAHLPLAPAFRTLTRRDDASKPAVEAVPSWIPAEASNRLNLVERWREQTGAPVLAHPARPRGYASLLSPLWQSTFEQGDASYTGAALEIRHPYVDIRLLRFLLRVPAVPWCRSKHLLRAALRGVVPESVRRRSKAPLVSNPDHQRVRARGLPPVFPSPALAAFGGVAGLAPLADQGGASVDMHLRLAALSYWLRDLGSFKTRGSRGHA